PSSCRALHTARAASLPARRSSDLHHFAAPWRIPHQIDNDFIDAVDVEQFAARFIGDHGTHAATGCGQGHAHFDAEALIAQGNDIAAVHQTQVHNIDRNFGIEAGGHDFPRPLLNPFFGDRPVGNVLLLDLDLQTQRVGVLPFDAVQVALHHYRDTAAQLLGDDCGAPLFDGDRRAVRYGDRRAIPQNLDLFALQMHHDATRFLRFLWPA